VLQNKNNYKQITVIPEAELIEKPEIESLKILEEEKQKTCQLSEC
jgi:hypothetical protein